MSHATNTLTKAILIAALCGLSASAIAADIGWTAVKTERAQYIQRCPNGVCPRPSYPVQRVLQQPVVQAQRPVNQVQMPVRDYLRGTMAREYDVRIEAPISGGDIAVGSGVAVGRGDNGSTLIATSAHTLEGAIEGAYVLARGARNRATVLAVDKKSDLAILRVGVKLPYVRLATNVTDGSVAQFRAYDGGQHFRAWRGRIIGHQYDSYLADTYAVSGNSGGGVFVDSKLVGVLWGTRDNRLAFAGVGVVRKLMARFLSDGSRGTYAPAVNPDPSSKLPYIPLGPPIVPDDPGPWSPSPSKSQAKPACNCLQQFQSINTRLDAIESHVSTPPASLPGPQGPAGPPGRDGKDATFDPAIESRINQLESQLAEVRARTPVTWDIVPKGE